MAANFIGKRGAEGLRQLVNIKLEIERRFDLRALAVFPSFGTGLFLRRIGGFILAENIVPALAVGRRADTGKIAVMHIAGGNCLFL